MAEAMRTRDKEEAIALPRRPRSCKPLSKEGPASNVFGGKGGTFMKAILLNRPQQDVDSPRIQFQGGQGASELMEVGLLGAKT